MTNALGAHGRRGRVSGLARAAALAVIATLTVVGAVRSDARVQLAAPSAGAGLPERSDVLIDEVALVCPGQQRAGALGLLRRPVAVGSGGRRLSEGGWPRAKTAAFRGLAGGRHAGRRHRLAVAVRRDGAPRG